MWPRISLKQSATWPAAPENAAPSAVPGWPPRLWSCSGAPSSPPTPMWHRSSSGQSATWPTAIPRTAAPSAVPGWSPRWWSCSGALIATNPDVTYELLVVMGSLTDHNPENRSAFGRAGVVAPLVGLLRSNPATLIALTYELLRAISNVACGNPENRTAFGRAGGGRPAYVAYELLWAIGKLTHGNPENCTAFGRAGVAAPLVELFRSIATNPDVASELLWAIGTLASGNPVNRSAFGRAGVAAPLVGLLRSNPATLIATHPDVASDLLRAIGNLACGDPENRSAFGRAGVAAPLVELLRCNPALIATNPRTALPWAGPVGLPRWWGCSAPSRPQLRALTLLPDGVVIALSAICALADGSEANLEALRRMPATRPLVEQLLAACPGDELVAQADARALLEHL
ncbi:hypothetical protein PAPYR_4833 [Paratrimastix pyriformis]|uniref:Uncharacterized protein n=1 Tax=Paratrimastix pyriformis TaxID=342808 RepID=A0ABQ8UNJ9_9EUKA|nr:hypothetical protein PAPYR_4833 [Paratrimastix pyriformis]